MSVSYSAYRYYASRRVFGSLSASPFDDISPLTGRVPGQYGHGSVSGGLALDESGFLASAHRRVVDDFIQAVLDEWACDMGDVDRNIVGVALRQEVETRLAPELMALHALLLGADSDALGRLPGWLDLVQNPMASDAEFLTEMGRWLDPVGSSLVEENAVLSPGESETAQAFTDFLWEMAPLASGPSLEP